MSNRKQKILVLTQSAMICAILIFLHITGFGFIMLPFAAITIMHIPVIVGAIMMGPWLGGFFGLIMGISSLINATFKGTNPINFAFAPTLSGSPVSSLIMTIGVRILIGIAAGLVFNALSKTKLSTVLTTTITAFVATLVNTAGVMTCLWLLFPKLGITFKAFLQTIIGVNFLVESVAAIIVAIGIAKALPALERFKIKK